MSDVDHTAVLLDDVPDLYTEEELERYGREVKPCTEGYSAIDIYSSSNNDDVPEHIRG